MFPKEFTDALDKYFAAKLLSSSEYEEPLVTAKAELNREVERLIEAADTLSELKLLLQNKRTL